MKPKGARVQGWRGTGQDRTAPDRHRAGWVRGGAEESKPAKPRAKLASVQASELENSEVVEKVSHEVVRILG